MTDTNHRDLTLVSQILGLPPETPITTKETSLASNVAASTLRKWAMWRRPGDLTPYIKRGGRNLYRVSDVRRFLGLEDAA